jgi:hypothetical protein
MATQEKSGTAINIPTWHRDLRATFETNKIGSGAVALLELINLQLAQAASYVGGLTGDLFVQRGLGSWPDDYEASSARLTWMVAKLNEIVSGSDPAEVKLVAIYNYVASPVLDGLYPADMLASLPQIGRRGIYVMPDGRGKSFGDAIASATLWNQAVVAGDVDRKLGDGWASNAIRSMLSQAATQIGRSAPGEPTTAADVTAGYLDALAAAPGKLLRAVGGTNVLLYGGIAVAAVLALVVATRD